MPYYAIRMNQNEVDYLDDLAAKYQGKPFIKCTSTKVRPMIELFQTTPDSRGFEILLMARLNDKHIQVGLDKNDYFVAFDVSCGKINQIMRGFFADIRESKANAEAKSASKVHQRPVFA